MIKRLIFVFAAATMLPAAVFSFGMDEQALKWTDESVRAIYDLDFDRAEVYIDKLVKANPDFPIAMFGKTMIAWSRFEYEYEKSNPAQAKQFEKMVKDSIQSIQGWIDTNGPDAYAYLALGGVYGVKGRFEIANRSFINAYFSGRKGLKSMNRAAKLDPQMYDAYLGEAVYQYYAGTLPAVVKVLAKLVVSGNAEKGIEYLNLVKDKGRFTADTAKLLLVEVYIENDKYRNPALAAQYIGEIIQKYPQNPLYRFVGIIADYENKDYDNVILKARAFLAGIGRETLLKDIYIARSYTAIGSAQMAKGEYEAAKKTFEQSIKATASQEMSRWQLWNILRLGQTLDILGKRDEAVARYKEVLTYKENWGMDDFAKKYIKTPYTPAAEQGRLSPP